MTSDIYEYTNFFFNVGYFTSTLLSDFIIGDWFATYTTSIFFIINFRLLFVFFLLEVGLGNGVSFHVVFGAAFSFLAAGSFGCGGIIFFFSVGGFWVVVIIIAI